jgi:superkiller protein 3
MRAATVLLVLLALLPATAAPQANDAEGTFSIGLTHLREGRLELALELFKKAAAQDPKNPYFQKGLGLAYLQMRKYDDAVAAFRKALENNPYYVDVHNDLGTALMYAGKRKEGKDEFLKAFNDPTNPTPSLTAYNLGEAALSEKDYAGAVSWYRTALERGRENIGAYLGLSEALGAQGQRTEALAALEQGVRANPSNLPLAVALADAQIKAGRCADARPALETVQQKDATGPFGRRARELLAGCPATP